MVETFEEPVAFLFPNTWSLVLYSQFVAMLGLFSPTGLSDNLILLAAIQDHAQRAHSFRSSSLVVTDQLIRARREDGSTIKTVRDQDTEKLDRPCGDHLKPSRDNYVAAYQRRTGQ